ncbi:hypothetical protein EDB80DRAFT_898713 [Ilyonectria destructans]|nr:hypothetical protein EDB80DRAFT_898713 [Ilyonectria destructans]
MIPAELHSNHNSEMKSRTSYTGPRLLAASRDISISRGATVCEETSVSRHFLRLFAAFASTAVLPVISPQDDVVNSEGPRATLSHFDRTFIYNTIYNANYARSPHPPQLVDRPYNQPSHLYPAKVQICTQHWDAFEEAVEAAVKDTEGTGKVERLCLDMLVGFLDHQLKRGDYDNVVLSALAVLGIREDNGWIDAIDYTPIYSAVVKFISGVRRGDCRADGTATGTARYT